MSQTPSRPQIDLSARHPEIMLRHLPPDVHATVEQVSANVSQSLDKLFGEFKDNIDAKAAEFANGILPADLEKQLDGIAEDYAKELAAGFTTEFGNLQAALTKAKKSASDAGVAAAAVQQDVAALSESVAALEKKLGDMHAKLKAFGGKSARVIVGGAVKYVTGGLL